MLTCLAGCQETFDDLKEIKYEEAVDGKFENDDDGRRLQAKAVERRQREHSAKQNAWRQARLLFDNGRGGEDHVVVGHVCPSCRPHISAAKVSLAVQGGA